MAPQRQEKRWNQKERGRERDGGGGGKWKKYEEAELMEWE